MFLKEIKFQLLLNISRITRIVPRGFIKILLIFVSFHVNLNSAYGEEYYYCHYNQNKDMSAFDRIFTLTQTPSGRVIDQNYELFIELVKTYDQIHDVITVYERTLRGKNQDKRSFVIFKLNLRDKNLLLFYANHMSVHRFSETYPLPYTRENVKRFNKNPEMLKYLPKHKPGHLAFSFHHRTYHCDPMNYLKYKLKSTLLFVLYFISG